MNGYWEVVIVLDYYPRISILSSPLSPRHGTCAVSGRIIRPPDEEGSCE
jgi:hypothetical protein